LATLIAFLSRPRIARARYYYAFASVVCGPIELEPGTDAMRNPPRLIEVLSRSAEAGDRGEKWLAYRQQLPSLQRDLPASQRHAQCEHYRRHEGGWAYTVHSAEESIKVATCQVLVSTPSYQGCWRFPGDGD
jgi:hypothetical protein